MQALIFANGEPNDGIMVQRACHAAAQALIIAADGGARVAAFFGHSPDVVIGDMDSIPAETLQDLENGGASIQRYPKDKNETDLELALLWAAENGATWIRIIGGIGGRFDQMLANVYLLALPQIAAHDVAIVAGDQQIRLLRAGTHTLDGNVGDTVSLIPVDGDVHGISTQHMRYPLHDETLHFGPARGVSNRMNAAQAHITLQEGLLLCVHFAGEAT